MVNLPSPRSKGRAMCMVDKDSHGDHALHKEREEDLGNVNCQGHVARRQAPLLCGRALAYNLRLAASQARSLLLSRLDGSALFLLAEWLF